MKLLIVTQILDNRDPILGFFHAWVEEFSHHCERVEVICLSEGAHDLPQNVHVHSLGKEKNSPFFLRRLLYLMRFWKLIFSLRGSYEAVFVHMNPEYVVFGGWWWKLLNKRVGLWYVHKQITLWLRLATMLADTIFTASKESFRIKNSKVQVLGHGIDAEQWRDVALKDGDMNGPLRIITIGRIGRAKRIREMLYVLEEFERRHILAHLTIVGIPVTRDEQHYAEEIRSAASVFGDQVQFLGGLPQKEVARHLAEADVFLHLSETGSLDKAVLEALLMGVPVVSTSEAFREMLQPVGLFVDKLLPVDLAERLLLAKRTDVSSLTELVAKQHSLQSLIPRIIQQLSTTV